MKFNSASFMLLAFTMVSSSAAAATRHRSLKSGKGGSKDECACDGNIYYKYVGGASPISWTSAYESTPDGCVLAPIESVAQLGEIRSVVPIGVDAWVGVQKSYEDILDEQAIPVTTREERLDDWFNLDGTSVPDELALWSTFGSGGGQPNNTEDVDTRAAFRNVVGSLGLVDLPSRVLDAYPVEGAVYQCCGENVDFCTVDPDTMVI